MKRGQLITFIILVMLLSASIMIPCYAQEEAPPPATSGGTGMPPLETPMPTTTPDGAPALALIAKSGVDLSAENNSDAAFSGRDFFT
jgi:hypothetical protein